LNITLNSKNEEIFKEIPQKNRNIIINSILTKSIENGVFLNEISFFLSSSEIDSILENIEIPNLIIKKTKNYYSKNKEKQRIKMEIENQKKKELKDETNFSGFD